MPQTLFSLTRLSLLLRLVELTECFDNVYSSDIYLIARSYTIKVLCFNVNMGLFS